MTNWNPGTGQLGNHVQAVTFLGAGLNDATSGGTYTGTGYREYKLVVTTAAATDKFTWTYRDSTAGDWTTGAAAVSMTGAAQTLNLGVTITFAATTGHTLNNSWGIVASGGEIRLLSSVTTVKTADSYTGTDEDDFNREDSHPPTDDLGDGWYSPTWQLYQGGPAPVPWGKALKIRDHRVENPDAMRALAVRTTFGQPEVADGTAYVLRFNIGPKGGGGRHVFHVYLQLNDLDPNMGNEGIDVTLLVTKTGTRHYLTGDVEGRYGVDAADITDFGDVGGAAPGLLLAASGATIGLSMLANGLTITATVNGVSTVVFGPTDLTMSPGLQGRTVGIGMESTNCWWLDDWYVSGLLLQGTPTTRKTVLIAGSNAAIYKEATPGVMSVVSGTAAVIASEYPLMAEELDGKLYIAEYADARHTLGAGAGTISGAGHNSLTATAGGVDWTTYGINANTDVVVLTADNGITGPVSATYKITTIAAGAITLASSTVRDGTCAVRVEKAPLVYDASAGTVAIWTATSGYGDVPTGCQLLARYRGVLVLARNAVDLSNWYMCRMKNPLDWDYSQTDYQAAAYYVGGDVGKPGDAITALIPWKDDLMIFGCANSLYLLRGHPKDGGSLDAISYEAGVLTSRAWCSGPTGAVYWLGPGGFYGLQSIQGDMNPKNLSENTVPRDLVGINPENYLIVLSYDTRRYGVWITITSKASGSSRSWFWDERLNAFWPDRYPAAKDPTAAYNYVADSAARSNLIFGGRDGRLRVFDNAAKDDEGEAIDSYVVYAPQALGNGDGAEGTLTELRADLSENTDRVDYELRAGKTFEAAVSATALHSGSWMTGGMRPALHNRIRGRALCLRLANANAGESFEVEQIIGQVLDGGKARY